jgi:hypothetical protein
MAACASALKFEAWKSPDSGGPFKKVAVFTFTKDQKVRRTVENRFAGIAGGAGTAVVPSYTFTSEADLKDKDAVVAKLKEGGFDGAVVFRLIAVDEKREEAQQVKYTVVPYSSGYYSGFGPYYTTYGMVAYNSTYTETKRVVQVETTLYALDGEKLAWAAQSKLKNPESTFDVIEFVVDRSSSDLKKASLIR